MNYRVILLVLVLFVFSTVGCGNDSGDDRNGAPQQTEEELLDNEEASPNTEEASPDTEEAPPDTEETSPNTEEASPNTEEIPPGIEFLQEEFTNDLGMNFKRIPAGTFMMGSPENEPGRKPDEIQHQVSISRDFYMQTTEVTQGQWREIMGRNPSHFSDCGDNCPVDNISWDDVQLFIEKLNEKGEGIYRLPTEAEWEYAARSGSATSLANGDLTNQECEFDVNLDAMGWYCGNSPENSPQPVAMKSANAWGLYDMYGNVWELCHDWYGECPGGAANNPVNGIGQALRGGSWSHGAEDCRAASRRLHTSVIQDSTIGFRLVIVQDEPVGNPEETQCQTSTSFDLVCYMENSGENITVTVQSLYRVSIREITTTGNIEIVNEEPNFIDREGYTFHIRKANPDDAGHFALNGRITENGVSCSFYIQ